MGSSPGPGHRFEPRLRHWCHQCLWICLTAASMWVKVARLPRGQQVSHQRWIWGIARRQESMQVSPPWLLKPRADITRSPKQGYQWPHKKDICYPKIKKKQKKNVVNVILTSFDLNWMTRLPRRWLLHFRTCSHSCPALLNQTLKIYGHYGLMLMLGVSSSVPYGRLLLWSWDPCCTQIVNRNSCGQMSFTDEVLNEVAHLIFYYNRCYTVLTRRWYTLHLLTGGKFK